MCVAQAMPLAGQEVVRGGSVLVDGLDHIVLAVADLEAAADRYRQLGFTLKPGTYHENGIRNKHAKFSDGTEIELLSVGSAGDPLAFEYARHLRNGDGPAFVALFAPDLDELAGRFDQLGRNYRRSPGLLAFRHDDPIRHIFFGSRNRSPNDLPEHFEHANGAEMLTGVWIAGDELSGERALLIDLGANPVMEEMRLPQFTAARIRFPRGEVLLLPGDLQQVEGRRIVGATVSTRNLLRLQQVMASGSMEVPEIIRTEQGASMFLPPDLTHGLWLEFREER